MASGRNFQPCFWQALCQRPNMPWPVKLSGNRSMHAASFCLMSSPRPFQYCRTCIFLWMQTVCCFPGLLVWSGATCCFSGVLSWSGTISPAPSLDVALLVFCLVRQLSVHIAFLNNSSAFFFAVRSISSCFLFDLSIRAAYRGSEPRILADLSDGPLYCNICVSDGLLTRPRPAMKSHIWSCN